MKKFKRILSAVLCLAVACTIAYCCTACTEKSEDVDTSVSVTEIEKKTTKEDIVIEKPTEEKGTTEKETTKKSEPKTTKAVVTTTKPNTTEHKTTVHTTKPVTTTQKQTTRPATTQSTTHKVTTTASTTKPTITKPTTTEVATTKPATTKVPETKPAETKPTTTKAETTKPKTYSCGSKGHHCKSANDHSFIKSLEADGCPTCGSHSCRSFYCTDEWGNIFYDMTKCPQYNKKSNPLEYCQVCGKKVGTGGGGTCVRFTVDTKCPECGKTVDAKTCHSH